MAKKKSNKSFLDKSIKELFSFNVDKEVKANADRSRKVVENFDRQGIKIIPRWHSNPKDWTIKLFLILVVGLLIIILTPSFLIRGLLAVLIAGSILYYIAKMLEVQNG